MTDLDLTAKADAKRAELARTEIPTPEPILRLVDTKPEEFTVQCDCGNEYRQTRMILNGKPWAAPTQCSDCRQRDEKREAEGKQLQLLERTQQQRDRSTAANWAQLAVPPKYLDVTLESFQHHGPAEDQALQMRALSWSRRFLAQWPKVSDFVVFRGEPGSGKGHVAWAIAKKLVEDGITSARNVKLNFLVRSLRDTWGRDGGLTYEKVLKGYTDPGLLIIDECSRHGFYGQNIHQHLYDVIDTRIEYEKPTILTTNEDAAGLMEILRPALFNRLEGEGGFVNFGKASWRSRPEDDVAA